MNQEERLRAIWDRSVEKLKEVVREFKITEAELHLAGDYFNRLGQSGMCRSLIDVALAMTSIDDTGAARTNERATGRTFAHLDNARVLQRPQCFPQCVAADIQPRRQVPFRREAITWRELSSRDQFPHLGGNLVPGARRGDRGEVQMRRGGLGHGARRFYDGLTPAASTPEKAASPLRQ